MYDVVRWIILGLLFAGLVGLWLWSRRKAAGRGSLGNNLGTSFRILQKRWIDQRTGICLVEAEEQVFLLAYTAGGGVSWQVLDKAAPKAEQKSEKTSVTSPDRLSAAQLFAEITR
jgi:hypothetical protein